MNANHDSRTTIAAYGFQWWLQAGVVLTLLFPALRGFDPAYGWWPLWLVFVPLSCLLILRPRVATSFAIASTAQRFRNNTASLRRQAVRYRLSR